MLIVCQFHLKYCCVVLLRFFLNFFILGIETLNGTDCVGRRTVVILPHSSTWC